MINSAIMYEFFALLPAVLSFAGFVLYLFWKNKKESPVVISIVDTIRSKSQDLPELDKRLSAQKIYQLLNRHPELREKLSQNDYNLLQYAIRSENRKDYLYGVLTILMVAISIFAYTKIEERQNRLRISNIELKGQYNNNIYDIGTTRDDLVISWNYEGTSEPVRVKVKCMNNGKSLDAIEIMPDDDFLIISNESLLQLWGCPRIEDKFHIRISFQTSTDTYVFGPMGIATALTVLYYFDQAEKKLEIMTQTLNCGLLPVDYRLKAIAWSKSDARIESRDIEVRNGKASVKFPDDFDIDKKTLKIILTGDYPDSIVRFKEL